MKHKRRSLAAESSLQTSRPPPWRLPTKPRRETPGRQNRFRPKVFRAQVRAGEASLPSLRLAALLPGLSAQYLWRAPFRSLLPSGGDPEPGTGASRPGIERRPSQLESSQPESKESAGLSRYLSNELQSRKHCPWTLPGKCQPSAIVIRRFDGQISRAP